MGPADLIGCTTLGPDAILAMVNAGNEDNDAAGSLPCRPDVPAEVTWLELMPDSKDNGISAAVSREHGTINERNPFKSLGDIAIAITTRHALPKSVEEYRRSKEKEESVVDSSRGIADAGVLVSYTGDQQCLVVTRCSDE